MCAISILFIAIWLQFQKNASTLAYLLTLRGRRRQWWKQETCVYTIHIFDFWKITSSDFF